MTLIYFIPIILAIAWSIKYDRQEEFDASKNHRFWFLCVILSLITGLSYALGGDKQLYLTEFDEYSPNLSDFGKEITDGFLDRGQMPGWVTVNMFAKVFFNSFYLVQILEAFWVNIAVFYTFKRYTQHVFLCSLLYCLTFTYFAFNTEVMREGFALGFCLYACEAYFRRKYKLAVLLFLSGLMFHVSAIIMLMIPVIRFRITNRRFVFVLGGALLFWFFSNFFFTRVVDMLLGQEGRLIAKILIYSTFSSGGIGAFVFFSLIYMFSPYWLMHIGIGKGSQDKSVVRRKETFMAMYLCISIVVISIPPLSRFYNYLLPFFLCMTTDMMATLFCKKRHFVSKVFSFLFIWGYTTFQYLAFSPKANAYMTELWFPYTSILNDDYDRSYRQSIHSAVIDGTKDDKNTRTVDE